MLKNIGQMLAAMTAAEILSALAGALVILSSVIVALVMLAMVITDEVEAFCARRKQRGKQQ